PPDAAFGQGARAVPAAVLRQAWSAHHRVEDRAAGRARLSTRRQAAAGLAGWPDRVPRAAEPDPHLALAAPAADLGLHLQRRDWHRGQDLLAAGWRIGSDLSGAGGVAPAVRPLLAPIRADRA